MIKERLVIDNKIATEKFKNENKSTIDKINNKISDEPTTKKEYIKDEESSTEKRSGCILQ